MNPNTRWKAVSAQTLLAQPQRVPWYRTGATAPTSWWDASVTKYPGFGDSFSTRPNSWFGTAMFRRALEGGDTLFMSSWEGHLVTEAKRLIEVIQSSFNVRIVKTEGGCSGNGSFIFSGEEAYLFLSLRARGSQADLEMATTSTKFVDTANLLFDRIIVQDDPQRGIIFTLAHGMGGYNLNRLGLAGSPIERSNYTPEIVTDFDHVVSDLKTDSPCGRLVILSGIPGSGKTYMVRGILTEVPQAAFVLVPSNLVPELSGPDLLPTFTSAKQEFTGPLVLIIEDADKVLVNRKTGDMNSISAMLNLGDGILGSVLDIRILCTTNAETLDMDPATRRKGRLCRHMMINDLPPEQAGQVFERLTGKTTKYTKPASLADIYGKARDNGWAPPPATSANQGSEKAVYL